MAKGRLMIAAVVAAATIGEGVFAIPYVVATAGWAAALGYCIAIIAVVSAAHVLYLRTLAAVGEKERLLGLARRYFGGGGFWAGFIAVVGGILLGFTAYLVLGAGFLRILFPALSGAASLAAFWLILSLIVWMSEGRIAGLEAAGVTLVLSAVVFVFASGDPAAALAAVPLAVPKEFFLPFGVILFSFAGWTSVEQVYELTHREGAGGGGADAIVRGENEFGAFWLFAAGTAFAGVLYWLFAAGVIGTVPHVTADTISGIGAWPAWRRDLLALVGLMSIAVVSFPLARELRGAMEKDLRWNPLLSRAFIIFLPLGAVLLGLHDFLSIIGLAGGLFIAAQYLLIISVGRRTLALSPREKFLVDIVAIVFLAAAVYEIWYFVV